MTAVAGVLGVAAVIRAISWLDDLLDRRQQQRAVIAEAEHYTRTAAHTSNRTDGEQQP